MVHLIPAGEEHLPTESCRCGPEPFELVDPDGTTRAALHHRHVDEQGRVAPPARQRALRLLVERYAFTPPQADEMLDILGGG